MRLASVLAAVTTFSYVSAGVVLQDADVLEQSSSPFHTLTEKLKEIFSAKAKRGLEGHVYFRQCKNKVSREEYSFKDGRLEPNPPKFGQDLHVLILGDVVVPEIAPETNLRVNLKVGIVKWSKQWNLCDILRTSTVNRDIHNTTRPFLCPIRWGNKRLESMVPLPRVKIPPQINKVDAEILLLDKSNVTIGCALLDWGVFDENMRLAWELNSDW